MALTMNGDVIKVTESDPVAVAARVRQLEEQIAGMPADAVDGLSADIGTVNSWLVGVSGQGDGSGPPTAAAGSAGGSEEDRGQGRAGRSGRGPGGQAR